jgi:hypothetical protein
VDFRHAFNTFNAELTNQPWDYTTDGRTLTVIPAGLPHAEPGQAEIMIRITASHTRAAEAGITTSDMPGLLAALAGSTAWSHTTILDDQIALAPVDDLIAPAPSGAGGVLLMVTEVGYASSDPASRYETIVTVHLPGEQLMPLASALSRAADVARGWED